MIDRIFSAALTFSLLIAGTLAIGAALFGADQRSSDKTHHAAVKAALAPVRIVQLERVVITAKRPLSQTAIAQSEAAEAAARRLE